MNDVVFSLILGFILLGGYSYLAIRQGLEVLRPRVTELPWLFSYRIILFLVFLFAVVTIIPSLIYQICLLLVIPAEGLLAIARITGRVNALVTVTLLIYMYLRNNPGRKE